MLLYIHVPFCRSKCRYCAFHSLPLDQAGPDAAQRYTDTLLAEIAFWADRLGAVRPDTVFFGGGTPSLLPAKAVSAILNRLRKAFGLPSGAEISFEANPESLLAAGYARDIASAGVTRLSLGVQSLDEESLRLLGRPHTERQALEAFRAARAANFASINLDLIWGLPGQKTRRWLHELARVVRMQPDHLSCYGLTLEDGTPLADAWHSGKIILPPESEQAGMYMHGAEYLEEAGYLQYEISNYARLGFQCRHNLGYWEGCDYLGLGPAAVSTLNGLRWTNPEDMAEWDGLVRSGLCGRDAERLSRRTRVLESVMLRLRTARGLRVGAYRGLTGRDFMQDNQALLRLLHGKRLVRIRQGYVRLTRAGMLVSTSILERLFDSIEEKLGRAEDGGAPPS